MKFVPARTLVGPLAVTMTSAFGVTVVPTGWLALLTEFESAVVEATVAMFVMFPLAGAVTVTVKLLVAFASRVPTVQLATPALVAPPGLMLKNTTFVGS